MSTTWVPASAGGGDRWYAAGTACQAEITAASISADLTAFTAPEESRSKRRTGASQGAVSALYGANASATRSRDQRAAGGRPSRRCGDLGAGRRHPRQGISCAWTTARRMWVSGRVGWPSWIVRGFAITKTFATRRGSDAGHPFSGHQQRAGRNRARGCVVSCSRRAAQVRVQGGQPLGLHAGLPARCDPSQPGRWPRWFPRASLRLCRAHSNLTSPGPRGAHPR